MKKTKTTCGNAILMAVCLMILAACQLSRAKTDMAVDHTESNTILTVTLIPYAEPSKTKTATPVDTSWICEPDYYSPAWSPDSLEIVFVADVSHKYSPLRIADMNLSHKRSLIYSGDGGDYYNPSWSPKGNKIAFYYHADVFSNQPASGVYTIDSDGQNLRLVTPISQTMGYGLYWSQDGNQLLYMKLEEGTEWDVWLWVVNSDGTGAKRIRQIPYPWIAAWSPDDSRIAYIWEDDEGADVYVANTGEDKSQNLTKNERGEWVLGIAWSPDNKRLIYTGYTDKQYFLHVINADGTGKKLVAEGHKYDQVAWSPNGEWLVLTEWVASGCKVLSKLNVDF